jgi:acyl-CoA thioesterase FadM
MKLVEYCREYHWKKDFLSLDNTLDSITKEIHTYFNKPLLCGNTATIFYKILSINNYSYIIDFQIYSSNIKASEIKMECVFYDSELCKIKKVDDLIVQKVKD